MIDIAAVLVSKYPGSEWALVGNEYEGLEWLSETDVPTKEEIEDLWPEVEAELQAKSQNELEARASALAKLAALGLTEAEIAAL
jgi:hypothetical protein